MILPKMPKYMTKILNRIRIEKTDDDVWFLIYKGETIWKGVYKPQLTDVRPDSITIAWAYPSINAFAGSDWASTTIKINEEN